VSVVNFVDRGLLLAALLLIAGTGYAWAGPSPSPSPSIEALGASSMRFDLREGFLSVVDGQIGPLEHLKFILDTGASRTILSSKLANRLSVPRQKSTIFNFDRQVATESMQIPQVRLGPIVASGIRTMVGDLGRYSEFARDVDAIIGLDVLTRAGTLRIDYDLKVVQFQQNSPIQQRQPLVRGAIAIQVLVQGQPAHLLVDTGLHGIVLYERLLRERHIKMSEGVPASIGHLNGQRIVLSGVRIGAAESNAPVFLINSQSDVVLAGVDGYLGPTALNAKWIELNFESMTMRWQ
jgi:predicted aspartyl protease